MKKKDTSRLYATKVYIRELRGGEHMGGRFIYLFLFLFLFIYLLSTLDYEKRHIVPRRHGGLSIYRAALAEEVQSSERGTSQVLFPNRDSSMYPSLSSPLSLCTFPFSFRPPHFPLLLPDLLNKSFD